MQQQSNAVVQPAGHQHHKLVYHLKMMRFLLEGASSLFDMLCLIIQG